MADSKAKPDKKKEDFPVVRHPYSRLRVTVRSDLASRTQQSHKDQCDINKILRRFDNTGELPPPTREAQYGDVTGLQGDLTERINTSREVLDQAGRDLSAAQQAQAEEERKRQVDLEEEVERLRQLEASVKAAEEKTS